MNEVAAVDQALQMAHVVAKNARRAIAVSERQVARDLDISAMSKRKQQLLELLDVLRKLVRYAALRCGLYISLWAMRSIFCLQKILSADVDSERTAQKDTPNRLRFRRFPLPVFPLLFCRPRPRRFARPSSAPRTRRTTPPPSSPASSVRSRSRPSRDSPSPPSSATRPRTS